MKEMSEGSKPYFAIAVAIVAVSFASILIKWSASPPFVIAGYRLGLTCLILLPVMFWTRGFSQIRSMGRREALLVILSGLALTFHFGLWIVSLTLTLVSTSVILVTSHPIFVASVQHFFLNEKIRSMAAIGITVAFSGVSIIALSDYEAGKENLLGDLFAFLGGICAGIYFLCGRVVRQKVNVIPYSFSVYGLASILLLGSAFVAGDKVIVSDGRELALFLAMAIGPTILGHTMFNYALKKVRAHVISTSVLGEPVGASLLAYILLPNQVPGIWIIIGGALVVLGLYVVLSRGYQKADEELSEPTL